MQVETHALPLWRDIQKKTFTKWKDLCAFLQLEEHEESVLVDSSFILNVPYRLAAKIRKGDIKDPILKQFLPTISELVHLPGYHEDPVGDSAARRCDRLLHKYNGRALIVTTSACAMHCRYCFRKDFAYDTTKSDYSKELAMIENDPTISEAILSGGDPLSLSDSVLEALLQKLEAIPHISKIRFHTRFPIGIPERIDASLLTILGKVQKQIIMVIHCNHPREFDEDVLSRLKMIQKLGIPILNQSVLLKGINDTIDTLAELCKKLSDCGIIPYYLHQLDRAQGTAHLEVSKEVGLALIEKLQTILPGWAVPRYVEEIAGQSSKTPIMAC